MALRKLNERNQITLPQNILRKVGVECGEYFEIYGEEKRIILKPVSISEKNDTLTAYEWDRLEALVAQQVRDKQFTEYESVQQAKQHIRKRMNKK